MTFEERLKPLAALGFSERPRATETLESAEHANPVITAIQAVAQRHDLVLDRRLQRNGWSTVFLEALGYDFEEARLKLRHAHAELVGSGVAGATLTYNEPLHPRVGEPVIEVDSVWWPA